MADFLGRAKTLVRQFESRGRTHAQQQTCEDGEAQQEQGVLYHPLARFGSRQELRIIAAIIAHAVDLLQAFHDALIEPLASFDALAVCFVAQLSQHDRLGLLLVAIKKGGQRGFDLLILAQFLFQDLQSYVDKFFVWQANVG